MNDPQKKSTSRQDYLAKIKSTKSVTLPSGSVFEIKKITGRDFVANIGTSGLKSLSELSTLGNEEKAKIIAEKMSDSDRANMIKNMEALVILATISPKLTNVASETELNVKDLTDADFYFLLNEISEFSLGGKDAQFFRKGQSTDYI